MNRQLSSCLLFLMTVSNGVAFNLSRRDVVKSISAGAGLSFLAGPKANAEEPDTRDLSAFNTLTFNYRRNDFGGLKAADVDGESISYNDFLKKLDSGDVKFVEFYAPDGDVAIATFEIPSTEEGQAPTTQKMRIGEGYPIEIHDGWSSPAFAIRTVKEKGVSNYIINSYGL